jgi:ABC-2 type transport system ATP-binding protein
MAANGRTICSRRILESERLAIRPRHLAGRLAALGLPLDPAADDGSTAHLTVRSSDDRRRAPCCSATRRSSGRARRRHALGSNIGLWGDTQTVPRIARLESITLFELRPTDDSLESVFSYLVRR